MRVKVLVAGATMAAIAISLFAQTPAGPKPSFEVASVKPNTTGDNRVMIMTPAPTRFVATNVFLRNMIMLTGRLGHTVVDKTGLKGFFDLRLEFAPDSAPVGPFGPAGAVGPPVAPGTASDPPGPSIFTAVQEQLGLRLESTKGPVEVLVIDSVQKPTEN